MNVTNTKATKITPALHFTIRLQRLRGRGSGFVSFFMVLRPPRVHLESERSAITAQSYCCYNKCRGDYQPEPETWRAEVPYRCELWAVDRVRVEGKSLGRESHQTVFQHRGEM